MEAQLNSKPSAGLARQVSALKLVSRLLAHELHAQGTSKQISLSREEVLEIQTTIDLFIEQLTRQGAAAAQTRPATEPAMLTARHN
jgi:hypothetical protein